MRVKLPFLTPLLILALALPGLVLGEAGFTSANFLKIGLGARAAAMGDSFTAVSDDPTALYWNPAGLYLASDTQISLTHSQWLGSVNDDYAVLSQHMGNNGAIGIGYTWAGVKSFLSTVENSSGGYAGLGTTASANDWALSVGYANSLGGMVRNHLLNNTLLGINANYVTQNENGPTGSAISFDAGMIQLFPKEHIALGLDLVNIGTSIQNRTQPFLIKGGISWYRSLNLEPKDRLTLAADADLHDDTGFQPRFGAEYKAPLEKSFTGALRLGLRTTDEQYGFSFLTMGAGISKEFGSFEAGLDYAFVPYGALGPTHRFTLNLRLDEEGSRLEADLRGPTEFCVGARRAPLDLSAATNAGVGNWQVDLTDMKGNSVREYVGSGPVPSRLDWDVRDSHGHQVPAGSYVATLKVDDLKDRSVQTRPVTLTARIVHLVKPLNWMISGDTVFQTGKSDLTDQGREEFTTISKEILKYFKDSPIEVGGHTDNQPIRKETKLPFKDNFELSKARAETVRDYLAGLGLDANNMAITYYADLHPADTNRTVEGRARNRRVEVKVLEYHVDSVEDAMAAGKDLMDHGQDRTAAQIFEGAMELDPGDPEIRRLIAECLKRDAQKNGIETSMDTEEVPSTEQTESSQPTTVISSPATPNPTPSTP